MSIARLAVTNLLDFIKDPLIPQIQLHIVLRQLIIRLPLALKKCAQTRQRILQALFFDFEERAFDTGEPKVFFTSI